ncbi:MAG: SprT-like domain-containing protein [Lachnospiraceae bacterium]|nr:SprT-like domain-containing protein [Lachnospiraceae bacterium]
MLKNMQEVLEYGFDVLNKVYFDGELPPIVITIMSAPRSNGHFTINREWRVAEERLNEINISAEHLDRPIENIMATLCHEMVHYYCQLNGIQDTSQNYRYHNKNFKREAEKRGLLISQGKYIGWSITNPSPEFIEIIKSHGIEKPMDINRDGFQMDLAGVLGVLGGLPGADGANGLAVPKKPKCSTRKYICLCCGNSFRATKDINVMCMDCDEQFIKEEK